MASNRKRHLLMYVFQEGPGPRTRGRLSSVITSPLTAQPAGTALCSRTPFPVKWPGTLRIHSNHCSSYDWPHWGNGCNIMQTPLTETTSLRQRPCPCPSGPAVLSGDWLLSWCSQLQLCGGGSQVCSTNEHSCSHYNDGLLKALLLLCVLLGHLCLL